MFAKSVNTARVEKMTANGNARLENLKRLVDIVLTTVKL